MSTSAIGTQLDAIRAGLVLRAGLSGVNVFSAPITYEDAGQECIAFGDARLDEVAFSMGSQREETWTIDFEIRVVKTWTGATTGTIEETIKAARDRVAVLFAELESYLNDTYTSSLPTVEVESATLEQYASPEGRVARIGGSLSMMGIKNP